MGITIYLPAYIEHLYVLGALLMYAKPFNTVWWHMISTEWKRAVNHHHLLAAWRHTGLLSMQLWLLKIIHWGEYIIIFLQMYNLPFFNNWSIILMIFILLFWTLRYLCYYDLFSFCVDLNKLLFCVECVFKSERQRPWHQNVIFQWKSDFKKISIIYWVW